MQWIYSKGKKILLWISLQFINIRMNNYEVPSSVSLGQQKYL